MADSPPQVPRTPSGLGRRGRALWRSTLETYELRADELATLEEACRTLDTCARLDDELGHAPLMIPGSTGQMRPHPLLAELRGHRQVLAQLVRLLALADVVMPAEGDDSPILTPRQARAQHAAQVRWGRPQPRKAQRRG